MSILGRFDLTVWWYLPRWSLKCSWCFLRYSMAIDGRTKHKPLCCLPDMIVIGSQVCTMSTVCCTRSVQSGSLLPRKSLQVLGKKRFPRCSAVPCANSSGNVYLTPTYDAACNLTRSRALCGVKEINLSVCDMLLLQLVHIQ